MFLQRLAGSKEEVDVTGAAVQLLSTLEADARRRLNELAVLERLLARFPAFADVNKAQRRKIALRAEWRK